MSNTFSGYGEPNFTTVPNIFFDFQMQELTGSEVKVMLYIFRHTYGYTTKYGDRKSADAISYSQFIDGITRSDGTKSDNGAGVSERSLPRALKVLIEKQYIFQHLMTNPNGSNGTSIYELNVTGYPLIHSHTANLAVPPTADLAVAYTAKITDTKENQNKRVNIPRQNKQPEEAGALAYFRRHGLVE